MEEAKQILECIFINEDSIPRTVLENGKPMVEIPPGRKVLMRMWSNEPSYARYRQVTYLPGGLVQVKINHAWEPPTAWKDRYIVEFHNNGDNPQAVRDETFSTLPIFIYVGIPRLIAVPIDSPNIRWEKVVWQSVSEKIVDPGNKNYMVTLTKLECHRTERNKAELKKIEALLRVKYAEKGEKEIKRILARIGLAKDD